MLARFVTGKDEESRLILLREGPMAAWLGPVPSHVELVVTDNGVTKYLGAHADGGVRLRLVGYDAAWLTAERFVTLPMPPGGDEKAEAWGFARIGEPYDFAAILDLALPAPIDLHEHGHCICSAFTMLCAMHGGAFASPLALPAHLVSPALLLFWLSGKYAIPPARIVS